MEFFQRKQKKSKVELRYLSSRSIDEFLKFGYRLKDNRDSILEKYNNVDCSVLVGCTGWISHEAFEVLLETTLDNQNNLEPAVREFIANVQETPYFVNCKPKSLYSIVQKAIYNRGKVLTSDFGGKSVIPDYGRKTVINTR